MQVQGVTLEPFNPLAVAISLNASFVARAYCGDEKEAIKIMKKAIQHKGFALIDMFQPCVTYNKVNTYQWFEENTYYLEESYDPENREQAFRRATEEGKFPLGVLYLNAHRTPFEDSVGVYQEEKDPL